ncbi:MAG TPA: hypothetical protein VGJ81_15705 [Thermoanaerobaculia bacterium]
MKIYRAATSTYVVFAIIFAIPAGAFALKWRYVQAREIVAVIAVAAAICFLWIVSFRIVITDSTLTFRSLFSTADIPRASIRRSRVVVRVGPFTGPLRLVVKVDRAAAIEGRTEIDINAKVFSRDAIRAVLELSPNAGDHSAWRG